MQRIYTTAHKAAIAAGVACLIVEIWATLEVYYGETKTLMDATMASVFVVNIASVIALKTSRDAWRQKNKGLSSALLLAFVLGAGFAVSTTLDRVATMRDHKLQNAYANSEELQQALVKLDGLERDAKEECKTVVGRTSFGEQCKLRNQEVTDHKKEIAKIKVSLDSMGVRIAAMLPFVTPEDASKYQPLLLPFALFLLENVLLVFGMDGQKVKAEFDLELKGSDALNAKAARLVQQWKSTHKSLPKPADVERILGVSNYVALKLLKEHQTV